MVARAGLRRGRAGRRRHRHLRLGHHRGHRRDVSCRDRHRGRRHRRRAGRAFAADRAGGPHLRLCAARDGRPDDPRPADRHPRDPARQGGPLRRHQAADGPVRGSACTRRAGAAPRTRRRFGRSAARPRPGRGPALADALFAAQAGRAAEPAIPLPPPLPVPETAATAAPIRIDRIALAGAFGSFIEPRYAMILGLVPDCDLAKCGSIGNAAGAGARMALLNRAYRREIEATVTRITKIETALEPDFQRHFVAAMAFPNKLDAYPELCRVQPLPNRGADGSVVSKRPDIGGSPVGDGRRRRAGSRARERQA
ncbi:DUF4445 domain-containing protein [Aurantimonas sp. DM33-3]|nr:DUF4445 domain-containing protein [Aurantimonas sp. DM33-3]